MGAPAGHRAIPGEAAVPLSFFVSDFLMLGFALLALIGARKQDRAQVIPRWQLLWPGGAALLSYLSMMIFPSPGDMLEPAILLPGVLGLLAGAVRGHLMSFKTDQVFAEAEVGKGGDATLAAAVIGIAAAVHFGIEMATGAVARVMPDSILVFSLCGGFLLGRSLAAWIRAYRGIHDDLRRD